VKLASFIAGGQPGFGAVVAGGIVDLGSRLGIGSLRGLLAADAVERARAVSHGLAPDYAWAQVTPLPVIPDPPKILCAGVNYRAHAAETGREVPTRPSIFLRMTNTLLADGEPMRLPRVSEEFDFEGELAVIIGRPGRFIPKGRALDHVAGYSCFVDGSVRDYQKFSVTAGKNFPATGPLGPWLVTADEIPDPAALTLVTRLNGVEMQRSGTDMLIHPVAELIAFCSEFTALEAGDVIATGTPEGVGHRRTPPLWMKPGDRLEVEISGIGILRNPIAADV
jgi:2-keto-4-pentenoate hydratase/2-oxohepta-3-ene-1,7-dioic acid hydratase in catechol pathway